MRDHNLSLRARKCVSTVIVMALLISTNVLLGPRFHTLALYREIVNEKCILSLPESFRRNHYMKCYIVSLIAGLIFDIIVSVLAYLLLFRRKSLKRKLALTVLAVIIANFLASLVTQLALVYPYKLRTDNVVSAIRNKRNTLEVVNLTVAFVNSSVSNSYLKPESMLELDELVGVLDVLAAYTIDLDLAHIILYQGWGSCGQYAILTAYILKRVGYPVRVVRFKDRDHEWAEVLINGTWYIVDPWYIGLRYDNRLLVPASQLAITFPSKGVIAKYPNGTEIDVSIEHGYSG